MLTRVAEVVRSDVCIGCGLCEAVTDGRVTMAMDERGSSRPSPIDGFSPAEERAVAAACPGVVASARDDDAPHTDLVWGQYRSMAMAWAGEPEVRFRAATGGVLTALGRHLLRTGQVAFVLHVGADPERPTYSRWVISETPDEVLANSGSWYGPAAPLAGLGVALDRGEPFAIIAKPCDLGAVHAYAAVDERVDRLCTVRLAMVCGGQSRRTKTEALLDRFGVDEGEVASLRFRGDGNPGPTRVVTLAGDVHAVGYLEMWADESSWVVETRCKLCPDALGECADVAAADAWPGGAPARSDDGDPDDGDPDDDPDDEGFNAIVVRTAVGQGLTESAAAAGALELGDALGPDDLNDFQPHQVRKKVALAARYEGVAATGVDPIRTTGLRVDELGRGFHGDRTTERDGTARRMRAARR